MIFKLSIVLDQKDDIFKEIKCNAKMSLEELHHFIVKSFDLQKNELAAFYLTNDEWEQGEEIPLIAMQKNTIEMNSITLEQALKNHKLLYVNDFLNMWRFMITVENKENTKIEKPEIILSFGVMPKVAPNVQFISESSNEDFKEEEDIFGSEFDEYNEFTNDEY